MSIKMSDVRGKVTIETININCNELDDFVKLEVKKI